MPRLAPRQPDRVRRGPEAAGIARDQAYSKRVEVEACKPWLAEELDSEPAPKVAVTIHPSAILRQRDEARQAERAAFAQDLRTVARAIGLA